MLFNSIQFAVFLPIVFVLYWLLRRELRWQNLLVLVVSYVFYGWWDVRFLLLIALTSASSFATGLLIGRSRGSGRKVWLWANVGLNLAVLGLFKYYDFFAQTFADLFLGGRADGVLLHLVLPVGISFYTFQALSYSIDVYRRTVEPTRDAVAFFAYVAFFPQLVAGPIERASSLLPQFMQPRTFSRPEAVDGLRQMLWGFFKKMVVADTCALYVDRVYAAPDAYGGLSLVLAALLFSIQIYGDFSGYSNIAIGCAKLFGITLRRNFNVPYFSRDIGEFWRRWHISLTSWFRDYVYIPMGGSRVPKWRVALNTMTVFLVSGFWHGANWTYLSWGLFHGLLFLPYILLGVNRRYRDTVASGRRLPALKEVLQMCATFLLVSFARILSRSATIGDAFHYMGNVVNHRFFDNNLPLFSREYGVLVPAVLLMLVVEWVNREGRHEFARQPRSRALRWVGYIGLIFIILCFTPTSEMPFIYFQF